MIWQVGCYEGIDMPRIPRAAIIGGGLGGLAACLALQRRGIEAVVYEQSQELSEIGAGLNLSPNALRRFARSVSKTRP